VRMVGVWVRNGNSTSTIFGNSTSTIWRLAINRYKRFGIRRPEIPWQIIGMELEQHLIVAQIPFIVVRKSKN
jgi:hypothetical protein